MEEVQSIMEKFISITINGKYFATLGLNLISERYSSELISNKFSEMVLAYFICLNGSKVEYPTILAYSAFNKLFIVINFILVSCETSLLRMKGENFATFGLNLITNRHSSELIGN